MITKSKIAVNVAIEALSFASQISGNEKPHQALGLSSKRR